MKINEKEVMDDLVRIRKRVLKRLKQQNCGCINRDIELYVERSEIIVQFSYMPYPGSFQGDWKPFE